MLGASGNTSVTSHSSSILADWLAESSLEFLAEWELFWIVALIGLGVFLLYALWNALNSKASKGNPAPGNPCNLRLR